MLSNLTVVEREITCLIIWQHSESRSLIFGVPAHVGIDSFAPLTGVVGSHPCLARAFTSTAYDVTTNVSAVCLRFASACAFVGLQALSEACRLGYTPGKQVSEVYKAPFSPPVSTTEDNSSCRVHFKFAIAQGEVPVFVMGGSLNC
jgi:hypothetical protein